MRQPKMYRDALQAEYNLKNNRTGCEKFKDFLWAAWPYLFIAGAFTANIFVCMDLVEQTAMNVTPEDQWAANNIDPNGGVTFDVLSHGLTIGGLVVGGIGVNAAYYQRKDTWEPSDKRKFAWMWLAIALVICLVVFGNKDTWGNARYLASVVFAIGACASVGYSLWNFGWDIKSAIDRRKVRSARKAAAEEQAAKVKEEKEQAQKEQESVTKPVEKPSTQHEQRVKKTSRTIVRKTIDEMNFEELVQHYHKHHPDCRGNKYESTKMAYDNYKPNQRKPKATPKAESVEADQEQDTNTAQIPGVPITVNAGVIMLEPSVVME